MTGGTDFYQVILGDRPGRVCVAVGFGPYRNADGKYKHHTWEEDRRFEWPAQRAELEAYAESIAAGPAADFYVCPAVRHSGARGRRKGDALPPLVVWADLDGEPTDPALFAQLIDLGGFVVESGTPGHRHAYWPLTRPVDLGTHSRLGQALVARLGADHKWSDETLLRLPGTYSYKSGEKVRVVASSWNGRRVDPEDLAELLGVDLTQAPGDSGTEPAGERPAVVAELAPATLPGLVRHALEHPEVTDRSAACARVIGACRDAHLTAGQALSLLATYPPARRYRDDRHMAADVARVYAKSIAVAARTSAMPTVNQFLGLPDSTAPTRSESTMNGAESTSAEGGESAPAPAGVAETPERVERARIVTGGSFIYDAPQTVPSIWGRGDEVLWAEGEPLMITGPTGVGKTTLGGQLVAGRLGLLDETLGYPVKPGRRVLYLAMDRPAQIARALGRLLRQHPREVLDERLVVLKGPPPADLGRHPSVLLALADEHGADTVVIDSMKDAASKLSDEETGQGLNTAMQYCVAAGIEVMAYHHQRKATNGAGGGKPTSISDVYGSAWLTAGCGSVVLLWGSAGDLVVELSHLKQPADKIGPVKLLHDHEAGRSRLFENVDLLDLIALPATVREIAMQLNDGTGPVSDAVIEQTRRKLETAVRQGFASKVPSRPGAPAAYVRAGLKGVTDGVTAPSESDWPTAS
ncbi:MAG: AAA family ATPase [Pseudonocardia sp.]|nr:AAA family ATPase [Pseudonocardia sp.]